MTWLADEDDLAQCVGCGLCLPHCPTWRVTGDEALSPRGRIAAMRQVQHEGAPVDLRFGEIVDTCIQCRGCEPACPSAVPFGSLMESTRATIAAGPRPVPRWLRLALGALGRPRLLRAGTSALAVAQRLRVLPRRVPVPTGLPVRPAPLASTGDDVWFHTGCVMDAWQRDVHAAGLRVLAAAGIGARLSGRGAACCGALHTHAGLADDARTLAERTMAAFPGDAPIVVDSAGCGAAMQEYGHLLGTPAAAAFSARVVDVHQFLALHIDALPDGAHLGTVAVQDPCHLRHVQRAERGVRTVLGRYADLVELDDDGLCCGAGGAYSVLQPDLSGQVRDRKLAAIERTGAALVASANPGCILQLAGHGPAVEHPLTLIDRAIHGSVGRGMVAR